MLDDQLTSLNYLYIQRLCAGIVVMVEIFMKNVEGRLFACLLQAQPAQPLSMAIEPCERGAHAGQSTGLRTINTRNG